MTQIASISLKTIHRPMRTTFTTALGSKSVATSVLVKVRLSDGSAGLGEVATSFVFPDETVPAISAVLAEAGEVLRGAPIAEYKSALAQLRKRHGRFHMTLAGLEVALFRADLAGRGVGEFAHWGGKARRIVTDITIPFIPGPELNPWLAKSVRAGFTTYKVKVSGKVDADLAFVQAVREGLSRRLEKFVIRLDGNQGYTAKTYLRMLDRLAAASIQVELFEQPLRRDDYRGMKAIRGKSSVPVILDETVFSAADCRRVIDQSLGDGVNIKIAKSGIAESAEILRLARRAGLKLMLGCMTETMVGLSAGIFLAAGTGAFDYIDLDSIHLLHHRKQYGPLRLQGPEYIIEA